MSTRPGSSPDEQLNKVQIPTYEYADGYEEHCRKILDDPHGKKKQFWQKGNNFPRVQAQTQKKSEIIYPHSCLRTRIDTGKKEKRRDQRKLRLRSMLPKPLELAIATKP